MAVFVCCTCKTQWQPNGAYEAPWDEDFPIDRCPNPATRHSPTFGHVSTCGGSTFVQIAPSVQVGRRWYSGEIWQRTDRSIGAGEMEIFRTVYPNHPNRRGSQIPLTARGIEDLYRLINFPLTQASAQVSGGVAAAATAQPALRCPDWPICEKTNGSDDPAIATTAASAWQPVPISEAELRSRQEKVRQTRITTPNARLRDEPRRVTTAGLEPTTAFVFVNDGQTARTKSRIWKPLDGCAGWVICIRCGTPVDEAIECGGDRPESANKCDRAICMDCAPTTLQYRHLMPRNHCCMVPFKPPSVRRGWLSKPVYREISFDDDRENWERIA